MPKRRLFPDCPVCKASQLNVRVRKRSSRYYCAFCGAYLGAKIEHG